MGIKRDLYDVGIIISELKDKYDDLVREKKDIEVKMAGFKNLIRTTRRRLPPPEYKRICRQQNQGRNDIQRIEKEIIPIKKEIRKWEAIKEEMEPVFADRTPASITNPDILRSLTDLRDRYIEFSGDNTRVNSMRLMAGDFASEITSIISRIES